MADKILEVKSLNVSFPTTMETFHAVKDVSLDIKEGEIFVIMGLSGSGKSTLIRSMTRLNDPTSGKLVVAGQDVTKATDKMLQGLRRKSLGMVFQHFALLPNRTVQDNISFPLEIQGMSKQDYEQKVNDLTDIDQDGDLDILISINNKIFTNDRQTHRTARLLQVFIRPLEKVHIGQY